MRWTAQRVEIGRQLFGVLWDPEHATADEIAEIKTEEREEIEHEDVLDGVACRDCHRVHHGHHCEPKYNYEGKRS